MVFNMQLISELDLPSSLLPWRARRRRWAPRAPPAPCCWPAPRSSSTWQTWRRRGWDQITHKWPFFTSTPDKWAIPHRNVTIIWVWDTFSMQCALRAGGQCTKTKQEVIDAKFFSVSTKPFISDIITVINILISDIKCSFYVLALMSFSFFRCLLRSMKGTRKKAWNLIKSTLKSGIGDCFCLKRGIVSLGEANFTVLNCIKIRAG